MLVPVGLVCQYQVSPACAVPAKLIVTPGLEHCGEFDVGFAGSSAIITVVAFKLTMPFRVTSSITHLVPLLLTPVKYKRKVTVVIFVKLNGDNKTVAD